MFTNVSAHLQRAKSALSSSQARIGELQSKINYMKAIAVDPSIASKIKDVRAEAQEARAEAQEARAEAQEARAEAQEARAAEQEARAAEQESLEKFRTMKTAAISQAHEDKLVKDVAQYKFNELRADMDRSEKRRLESFCESMTLKKENKRLAREVQSFKERLASVQTELDDTNGNFEAGLAALRTEFQAHFNAAVIAAEDYQTLQDDLETAVADNKRQLDTAHSRSDFWKTQHDAVQGKLAIMKDKLQSTTADAVVLKVQLETTSTALAQTEDQLEASRKSHMLTKQELDTAHKALVERTGQLQCSVDSNAVCFEQLQSAQATTQETQGKLADTQTGLAAANSTIEKIQNELDDERVDHEIARQTQVLLSNGLNAKRTHLATLEANITVASKARGSDGQSNGINQSDALVARLRARLRDTSNELMKTSAELLGSNRVRDGLQERLNNLACTRQADCMACPHHMRRHAMACRMGERKANQAVDQTSFEVLKLSSDLQDFKRAVADKVGMDLEDWLAGEEPLSARSGSTLVG
ncbi:hypothetical protein K505DRAFT_367032 [Melanomma pulvis-pyrius CBS 109.77]|uniref:Uncharacterized protein n=1 Tax=Melanomma pulvis-pyrius CBS 109.77 TaxID=1314802 RepID=A0A6A6WUN4_9PLEO|nr:hypothetical protein K505DRAFT_367032 [Melanomma pulvis-pyrius CBS 109.77]